MKGISTAIGVAAGLFAVSSAFATPIVQLIDFDTITTNFATPVPKYYDGLNWLNYSAVAAAFATPIGLQNAVVSTSYVAVNTDPSKGAFFYAPNFTLKDAYFGAGARDGLVLNIFGFDRQFHVIDSTTFTVDTHGALFDTFNWSGLYAVGIGATGGVLDPQVAAAQDSTIFALDNLRVSFVPEPGTTELMLAGLGVGALALRRRRAA